MTHDFDPITELGLTFRLVQQTVYLVSADLTFVGKPVPRKHLKLAFNQRRKELATITEALKHLLKSYVAIHEQWMPALINEQPVHMESVGSLGLVEPTKLDQFYSPVKKHIQFLFDRVDPHFPLTRRARVHFLAATHEEAKHLLAWIRHKSESWDAQQLREPINHGLKTLAVRVHESAINMHQGTFMSLDQRCKPEQRLSVQ